MQEITRDFKEALKYIEDRCFDPFMFDRLNNLLYDKVTALRDEGVKVESIAGSLVLRNANEFYGLESEKIFPDNANEKFPILTLFKIDNDGKATECLYGIYFKQVQGHIVGMGLVNYAQEH